MLWLISADNPAVEKETEKDLVPCVSQVESSRAVLCSGKRSLYRSIDTLTISELLQMIQREKEGEDRAGTGDLEERIQ